MIQPIIIGYFYFDRSFPLGCVQAVVYGILNFIIMLKPIRRIQCGPTSDTYTGILSFFSSLALRGLFSKKKHPQLKKVGTSPLLSSSSATDSPTSSPLQNRSMTTPHGPYIPSSDPWDRHGKTGDQLLLSSMEAREPRTRFGQINRDTLHGELTTIGVPRCL